MAPELFEERPFSAKVDVYAFGVLLNEMFSRRKPFGETSQPAEIREKVVAGGRPEMALSAPEGVRALVARCWAQEPGERPDMPAVARELAKIGEGLG